MALRNLKYYYRLIYVLIFTACGLLMAGAAYLLSTYDFQERIHHKYEAAAFTKIDDKITLLQRSLVRVEDSLKAIQENPVWRRYVETGETEKAEELFRFIMLSEKSYDQIRFLDGEGRERIRLDRSDTGGVHPVPVLQEKKQRYYFRKAVSLPYGEFYVSSFDLNMENGQVEIPYVPTFRIALPTPDRQGRKGILIINVMADDLLKDLERSAFYDVIVTDARGTYLLHPDPKRRWSGPLGREWSLPKDDPALARALLKGEKASFRAHYAMTFPQLENQPRLILRLKEQVIQQEWNQLSVYAFRLAVLLFLLSLPIALLMALVPEKLQGRLGREMEARLASEASFRYLFNNMRDAIFIMADFTPGGDGRFVEANPYAGELLGYSYKELLKKKPLELFANESEKHRKEFIDLLFSDNHRAKEVRMLRRDGTFLDVLMHHVVLHPEEGRTEVMISARDVTELKRMQREKEEQNEFFLRQSRTAAMGEMITSVAHHWRQPLSVISMQAYDLYEEAIEHHPELEEKLHPSLLKIESKVQELSQTIERFRYFYDRNRVVEPFDIHGAILRAVHLVENEFKAAKIGLELSLPEDPCHPVGDAQEFVQVMLALLTNAEEQFAKGFHDTRRVKITLETDETHYHLAVEDTGGGMPDEILPRIFEPYFTTKQDLNGTGLGLYVAYKAMERMDGTIRAENGKKGAVFRLTLQRRCV